MTLILLRFARCILRSIGMLASFQENSRTQVGRGALAVLVVLAVSPAFGQSVPAGGIETAPAAFPATVASAAVGAGPLLDGDVLGDPVWADVPAASGFVQTQPDEGQPATERTEVRVLFDDDTLYFGIVCYDRDPAGIVVSDSRRDSSLGDSDSIQIILDTFRDEQSAFVFGTSPAGHEYDGQVANAGQGGRGGFGGGGASRGSGGGFNRNWDGAWEVRTQISEVGWSAEFAIPFRTISYPNRAAQTWGMNIQRNIRRRNEEAYWAPLPRQFNLLRLSLAGQLSGIRVPASASRNLKVTPYVVGEAAHSDADVRDTTMGLGDVGADVKYAITPSLTLDLTYNTDFAQVEVDQQQINLDRFSLFFPEKRPFFLENAGGFTVSNGRQSAGGSRAQTELFFSRRIGIGLGGREIPILGGARMSGKVSDSLSVGLLNMQTESVAGVASANNFTVARVRRDLPNRSNIGVLLVNRQATGDLAATDDYNRTYALDGRWGIGQNGQVTGFMSRTETPGLDGDDHAYNLVGSYNSELWQLGLGYFEIADNFNPEVGFLRRSGFRNVDVGVAYTFRPKHFWKLQQMRPHGSFNRFWNFEGQMETSYLHFDYDWEFNDSSMAKTTWNVTGEGVTTPFEIADGVTVPVGVYEHNEAQFSYNSNRGAPVSFGVRTTIGGFFGGDRVTWGPSVDFRAGDTVNASIRWSRNDITLPGGSFVTNLTSATVAYNFSPRLFAQALVQYNDSADLWSANLRFGLVQQANTGLFIVYTDTRGLHDTIPSGAGRSLILKYSRLFDLID